MSITLGQLAVRFGCELKGNPDTPIDSVATLQRAPAGSITFLANPKYRRYLATTGASAVILDPSLAEDCPVAALLTRSPYVTYARVASLLHPQPVFAAGVHARALVDTG